MLEKLSNTDRWRLPFCNEQRVPHARWNFVIMHKKAFSSGKEKNEQGSQLQLRFGPPVTGANQVAKVPEAD